MKKKMLFYSKLLIFVFSVLGLFFLLFSSFLKRREAQNLERIQISVEEYLKEVEQYYVTSKAIGVEHYPTKVADLNGLIFISGMKPSRGSVQLDENYNISKGEFCVNGYYVSYEAPNIVVNQSKKCEEIH